MQQNNFLHHKKAQKNSANINRLLTLLFCWTLPLLWVISIPRSTQPWKEQQHTMKLLKHGEFIIEEYQKYFGYAPRNLSEIRAFSSVKSKRFSPWDTFGQRLDYMTFDSNQWFLRSFGMDGKQNTLMTPQDPLISNINSKEILGIKHEYYNTPKLYNPVILLGSISPEEQWHAQALQDPISGNSKLLIRHRKRGNYFLVSPHDTVEEFFWLPDGYRVVYSVTGSNRYKDGIYLWNLIDDDISLVFPERNTIPSNSISSTSKYWNIALAGVTKESPPKLLAYIEARNHTTLSTNIFFTSQNLYGISFPVKKEVQVYPPNQMKSYQTSSDLFQSWQSSNGIKACETKDSKQKSWCQLKLPKNKVESISNWQDFAEIAAQSPLFPYTLFHISRLYLELVNEKIELQVPAELKEETIKEVEILKSYGQELSSALSNLPTSPSWMRGAARQIFHDLQSIDPTIVQIKKIEEEFEQLDKEPLIKGTP